MRLFFLPEPLTRRPRAPLARLTASLRERHQTAMSVGQLAVGLTALSLMVRLGTISLLFFADLEEFMMMMDLRATLPEAHPVEPNLRGVPQLQVFVSLDGQIKVQGNPLDSLMKWRHEPTVFVMEPIVGSKVPDMETVKRRISGSDLTRKLTLVLHDELLDYSLYQVVIIADVETEMEHFSPVFEAARNAGFTEVRFMTARRPDARL